MTDKTKRWSREELLIAFNSYCQMPFGKMHKSNPEIVRIAHLICRTPSSLAMKLVNFASLDPAITSTGRRGLGNASTADKSIWDEFHADWEKLAVESRQALQTISQREGDQLIEDVDATIDTQDYMGLTKTAQVELRIKQSFFRKAVLSSYSSKCCMSKLSVRELLNASHIVPWAKDKANRLNPRNGLCLSALHDRAFDKGLITVTEDYNIMVSQELHSYQDNNIAYSALVILDGKPISLPQKFHPDKQFLRHHNEYIFRR